MESIYESDEEFFDACESIDDIYGSNAYSNLSMKEFYTNYSKTNTSPSQLTLQSPLTEKSPHRFSQRMSRIDIITASLKIINKQKSKSTKLKESCEFNNLRLIQEVDLVDKSTSKVWVLKFCPETKILAIGGQSGILCLYEIFSSKSDPLEFIQETPLRLYAEHENMITEIS